MEATTLGLNCFRFAHMLLCLRFSKAACLDDASQNTTTCNADNLLNNGHRDISLNLSPWTSTFISRKGCVSCTSSFPLPNTPPAPCSVRVYESLGVCATSLGLLYLSPAFTLLTYSFVRRRDSNCRQSSSISLHIFQTSDSNHGEASSQ